MEISPKQVCDDLMELTWRFKSTMFHLADAHGLTIPQLFTLHAILHEGTTMGRVAEIMHCDASNITGVVDRLVAQGLVVRSESRSDRRTKVLALTPEGNRVIQGIIDSLPERLGCSQLNEQERQVLHTVVRKLSGTV